LRTRRHFKLAGGVSTTLTSFSNPALLMHFLIDVLTRSETKGMTNGILSSNEELCERLLELLRLQLGLDESNFPSVTFCNTNPYKRSKIQMVPALQALMTVYEASADGSLT
uniref:HECT domain-containing protein n=1 Tax=Heligmosomoides polygyrus TaxID=6339 RepID=A0A183G1T7_HELPZ